MYHLPSNWTAQRSAEQESETGYLARIRKGEARDAMDSTITMIEKTQGPPHHSDPLEAPPDQAGGEKAPCVHNKPYASQPAAVSGKTTTNLVTKDGGECKHRCDTATESRPLGVFESTYSPRRPRKELLLHRAHTLTDLSVTKPRPRPGNFVEATPLVSTP